MNIKRPIYEVVYQLYQHGILHNKIIIKSLDETVEQLLNSNDSIVRFGDGDFQLISGQTVFYQDFDPQLQAQMLEIINSNYEGLLIGLPDIFEGVSQYAPSNMSFWKEHLFYRRKTYYKYCISNIYYNAFFSRPYIMYADKSVQGDFFKKVKKLWDNRDIVIVEGYIGHNGVGNDLFDNTKSISRILCPSTNAYRVYDEILANCQSFSKGHLFLMAIGAAGKAVTLELFKQGYRIIDIGNLDMEYGWFLEGATAKCRVPKHEIVTVEDNIMAGYTEYLDQVYVRIE